MSDYTHEIKADVYESATSAYYTTAYIDSRTGIGRAKHSGRPIDADWDEDAQRWIEEPQ